jgi:allantoinase
LTMADLASGVTSPVPFQMASERAALQPLDGKLMLVHVVVNVEHWQYDQPMPRKILTSPRGADSVPDIPNFSWAEYGLRVGLPRILAALAERGLPASVSLNAGVIDAYPAVAQSLLDSSLEVIGHGVHQRPLPSVPDERVEIAETLSRIEAFAGRRPRGWLGPGLQETAATPRLLKDAGIGYVFDWVLDDVPVWLPTESGPLIAMPYAVELNDTVAYAVEHQASGALLDRVADSVATFEREARPVVVTLALHPHLIGVPHRIGYLLQALDLLKLRSDTTFVTGSRIATWFTAQCPPP